MSLSVLYTINYLKLKKKKKKKSFRLLVSDIFNYGGSEAIFSVLEFCSFSPCLR